MTLGKPRRLQSWIVMPFCFAIASGCNSQRDIESGTAEKATETAPVAAASPIQAGSADHGTFFYDSMEGHFAERKLNANMAAQIRKLINNRQLDFDPKFLEKSEPYGEFRLDGRVFEFHHELLVEIRSRQFAGIWSSELIVQMTNEFIEDAELESIIERILARLDGTVDLPPRRPRKAHPLESSVIDREPPGTRSVE